MVTETYTVQVYPDGVSEYNPFTFNDYDELIQFVVDLEKHEIKSIIKTDLNTLSTVEINKLEDIDGKIIYINELVPQKPYTFRLYWEMSHNVVIHASTKEKALEKANALAIDDFEEIAEYVPDSFNIEDPDED